MMYYKINSAIWQIKINFIRLAAGDKRHYLIQDKCLLSCFWSTQGSLQPDYDVTQLWGLDF